MSMRSALVLGPLAAALVAVAAAGAVAQSIPGTAAKNAARRAVAATNAQMAAEQNTGDPAPAKPAARPTPATRVAVVPRGAATQPAADPKPAKAKVETRTPAHVSAPPAHRTAAAHTAAAAHVAPNAKGRDTLNLGGDGTTSISERGGKNEISLMRESFTYSPDGRRDPFVSLIASGELRPMISDLKLVVVIYDPAGGSVAILRDLSTREQYRIKTGQTLGRMRVARIDPKSVTFTLEEYGYSRQESLALNDSTRAR